MYWAQYFSKFLKTSAINLVYQLIFLNSHSYFSIKHQPFPNLHFLTLTIIFQLYILLICFQLKNNTHHFSSSVSHLMTLMNPTQFNFITIIRSIVQYRILTPIFFHFKFIYLILFKQIEQRSLNVFKKQLSPFLSIILIFIK